TLPAGVTVASVSPSTGFFSITAGPDGTWAVGNLAAGFSATLTIVLQIGASAAHGATISSSAAVTATNETRIHTGDDSATQTATVRQIANLKLTQQSSATTVRVGKTIQFTLTLTNLGPTTATGVQITELLPPGLHFVSATASRGAYHGDTGI